MSDVQNMIRRIQKENGIPEYGPFWHLFPDDELAGNGELWANCLIDLLYHTGCPANDEFVFPGTSRFTMQKKFQGGPVEVSVSDQGITVGTVAGVRIFEDAETWWEYIKEL